VLAKFISDFKGLGTSPAPMCVTVWKKTQTGSVLSILSSCYVFKIVNLIIYLIAVFMVHLMLSWCRAKESNSNQPMNGGVGVFSESSESNARVAVFINLLLENAASITTLAHACVHYPAVITNVVRVFKADHRKPNFSCGMILFGQGVSLRDRFTKWLGSLNCSNSWRAAFILP